MGATRPHERRPPTPITVQASGGSFRDDVIVMVPDSGANVDAVERALIAFALERTRGNRTHAARFLGLSRRALLYRMHKHGLVERAADDRSGSEDES